MILRTHDEAARAEADTWRAGIRDGRVRCTCRFSGQPVDETGHRLRHPAEQKCALDYGIVRVYELERKL